MNKGLTLPNRMWGAYTATEVVAVTDLGPDALVFLLYGNSNDLHHEVQITPYLNARHPRILYRPYADNIAQRDPVAWARQCWSWISQLSVRGEVIPANELNIEGMAEFWDWQIAWLTAFAQEWRLLSSYPLHLPALSPTGNWIDGYAAYRNAGLYSHFDAIDVHAYADPRAIWMVGAQAGGTGQPLHLTEWNQMDPTAALDTAKQAGYTSATYFLCGGTPDQAQYDILLQPATYQGFKNWSEPHMPTYTMGFDISNNNGNVNWGITGNVEGYDYASIKAAEGKNFKDGFFLQDWDAAGKAGLVRQAYDFGRPSQGSGRDDAKAFLSIVEPVLKQYDSVCLDLEDTNVGATADLHAYAMDWLTTVENALGFKPMFYSGRWYTKPHNLEGHADLAQYGLWIASYVPQVLPDITGMGWDFWAAWQYGAGPLPGIAGVVDFDVFNGSIDLLRKYGKPS